ncbi:MAG: Hsp20/alpha crystallin family protein [Gemmatimonadota bacterium]|nr:Hsp20/alpha crystallin family protein [Gemmatimonadota bacterium]
MLPVIKRHRSNVPSLWEAFEGDRGFDRLLNTAFGAPSISGWSPAVDVRETAEDFLVTAELPGMAPDQVEVTVENGVLSISGEKKEEAHEESGGFSLVERRFGQFQRNFSIPRGVDADKVEAKFKHGVLNVVLPKAPQAKPKQIKITG